MEQRMESYYTPQWSQPDVVMHFAGVEGPMRDEKPQQLVDFGHQPGVTAYTENQWHPLMRQSDSVPTAVFEVPAGTEVPEEIRSYAEDLDNRGLRNQAA